MGDAGIYGCYCHYHALLPIPKLVNPEEMLWGQLRVLAMTTSPYGQFTNGTLQDNQDSKNHEHRMSSACLVVCNTYEINGMFPQSGPYLRWLGAGTLAVSLPCSCQGNAMGGSKRTECGWATHVLSDDSSNHALLFLLQDISRQGIIVCGVTSFFSLLCHLHLTYR